MRLTPKAQALQQPIRDLLAGMTALLDPPEPDLATLHGTVRVDDGRAAARAADRPNLSGTWRSTAPRLTLAVLPWQGVAGDVRGAGAAVRVDLAISVFSMLDADFTRRELLREHYVVAMRRDHPAAAGFDLERWLAYPHMLVSGRGETLWRARRSALQCIGRRRHIGLVVPSFLGVPPFLSASDLIALLPSRTLATR
jgi:DNA-binding transcriptional LysR family regulator